MFVNLKTLHYFYANMLMKIITVTQGFDGKSFPKIILYLKVLYHVIRLSYHHTCSPRTTCITGHAIHNYILIWFQLTYKSVQNPSRREINKINILFPVWREIDSSIVFSFLVILLWEHETYKMLEDNEAYYFI